MITDLNYLKTMSGGDDKFISEMIDLFREQIGEYTELMPRLLHNKEYRDLSKLAHKAKSSVAVMGMNQVADLLKEQSERESCDPALFAAAGRVAGELADAEESFFRSALAAC